MKRWILLVLTLFAMTSTVIAQKPAKPTLSAATILDRYVDVTGGKAAYSKLKSMAMKGTIAITGQNLKGTIEVKAKAPNKFFATQTIEGVGTTNQAFDGKKGWSQDAINGIRELTGKELTQLADQAIFNSPLRWREIYAKTEVLGIRKVDGKETYALRLTPKAGAPTIQYHDSKTFLVVRIDSIAESPQGRIPIETYLSDYRTVDGVKTAFATRQRFAASELVMQLTELKTNTDVPDSLFAKPAK